VKYFSVKLQFLCVVIVLLVEGEKEKDWFQPVPQLLPALTVQALFPRLLSNQLKHNK